MIEGLASAVIGAALVLAVWGGIMTARDRPPERSLYTFTLAVTGMTLVLVVVALFRLPGSGVDGGLFVGYALTAILLLPAAISLARMEPTRWGSGILAAGGLVLAPLTLRLQQIWELAGA